MPEDAPENEARDAGGRTRPLWMSLVKLARPVQWSKSSFVLIGPFYGLNDLVAAGVKPWAVAASALIAAAAFALASSGCYVLNDLADREADRAHPRKRHRPIASGDVSVTTARIFACVLFLMSAGLVALLTLAGPGWDLPLDAEHAVIVAISVGAYVVNVMTYSAVLKHKVIADVMSLSLGFVLRVVGGCAAVSIEPTVWLLNVVFFLSMFLAFGKRLGERRTLAVRGAEPEARAVEHRRVQRRYTDALLRIMVAVTAVITLMTYALYVQEQSAVHFVGFNVLWLTVLPATYGLLRCIVLLEEGRFDDPTELAVHDRGFQLAGIAFGVITVWFLFSPLVERLTGADGAIAP